MYSSDFRYSCDRIITGKVDCLDLCQLPSVSNAKVMLPDRTRSGLPGNLESHIFNQMATHETEYGIKPLSEARTGAERLQHLIISLYRDTGQTVVILVDEYDKPILDVLENQELAQANRDYLRGFYGIIQHPGFGKSGYV